MEHPLIVGDHQPEVRPPPTLAVSEPLEERGRRVRGQADHCAQAVADPNTWVDRVGSAVLTLARNDDPLATRLADDHGDLLAALPEFRFHRLGHGKRSAGGDMARSDGDAPALWRRRDPARPRRRSRRPSRRSRRSRSAADRPPSAKSYPRGGNSYPGGAAPSGQRSPSTHD